LGIHLQLQNIFSDNPHKSVSDVAKVFGWTYANAYAAVQVAHRKGNLKKT